MILKIFTVYDSKVEAFLPPFFLRSTGEAIRSFTEAVRREGNFKSNPADFTLFELGAWDDVKSQFVLKETPVSLGLALEFVSKEIS